MATADMGMATRSAHREGMTFADALRRARAEFLEMPGLQLTVQQASRLWAFDAALCGAVLEALVDARFLVRSRHAMFTRAS